MLEEKINADIKTAMLARDQKKLETLRAIKSVILLLKTSAEGYNEVSETKALQKEVKKRKETAEIYKNQNRSDMSEAELYQASVIESYLPKQMSEEELKQIVSNVIAQTGASSPADMGKVIGAVMKQTAGKADGKTVAEIVKQMLIK